MNTCTAIRPVNLIGHILLAFVLLSSAALEAWGKDKGAAFQAKKGQKLYTQFSLFYEKGCHITTNYRRGALLPVNTEVTFIKAGGNKIFVALPGGQEIFLHNVRDYSGEDLNGIFSRTLSTTKVELDTFTAEEQQAIRSGRVVPGMTKKAVLVAIGYPPKHKTPTLDLDQWRYWSSRYGTFMVHFEDGRVKRIQN